MSTRKICRTPNHRAALQSALILAAAMFAFFVTPASFAATPSVDDSNVIFSYAEAAYPQFFSPSGAVSQTLDSYYYRYYSGTNAYIATANDGRFYYLGPESKYQILDLGTASDWVSTSRNGFVIESNSQAMMAAQGGTITLPGGSSVTIPAGALAFNQTVTLSLTSRLLLQPPGGLIQGVGPVLSLAFSTNQPFAQTTGTQGVQFVLKYGATPPARLAGAIPIVDIVDDDNFAALVPLPCDSNSTCTVVPLSLIQTLPITTSIHVSAANTATDRVPLPQLGNQSWNGTSWKPGVFAIDPAQKYLILVHGMLSSTEDAFGDRNTVENIRRAGGYDKVLGFNYDWSKGVDQNGAALSSFLTSLKSAGLQNVDLEAHSEGGPVTLSALCRNNAINIGNVVMLGSPVTGTPAADIGTAVQLAGAVNPLGTVLLNLPSRYLAPSGQTARQLMTGQFAADLRPGSTTLSNNNSCVASKMNQATSTLGNTQFVCVGGSDYSASGDVSFWLGTALKKFFGITPFDGVVPTTSAMCEGAGFNPARVKATSFPLSHTRLQSDLRVATWVGSIVKANVTPTLPNLTGTWSGSWNSTGPGDGSCIYNSNGTLSLTLKQNDSSLTGTASVGGIQLRWINDCSFAMNTSGQGNATGTVSSSSISVQYSLPIAETGGTHTGVWSVTPVGTTTLQGSLVSTKGGTGSFTLTRH